jgi:cation transport ATPase
VRPHLLFGFRRHIAHASSSFRLRFRPRDSGDTSSTARIALHRAGSNAIIKPIMLLLAQAVEFFETSALLITFIALGKLLEGAAKGRTSRVRI